jgi:hypothetical protein
MTASIPPELFSDAWLRRFQERANADPELEIIGRWFTTAFLICCGDRRVVIRVDRGRITDMIPAPRLDVRSVFTFRASSQTWARFLGQRPEPLYHDLFAMLMRVPDFTIEGDTLAAMQHARALHRLMNLMRLV